MTHKCIIVDNGKTD